MLLLAFLIVLCISIACSSTPFDVYWNVPTSVCSTHDIYFNVSQYGIMQNSEDNFYGDQVLILYDPGVFPAYLQTKGGAAATVRNGGIPQLGNISLHLDSVRELIQQRVPDTEFTGLGVLDMEYWRPSYRQNFLSGSLAIYQEESKALERRLHPGWESQRIDKEAERRFEQHARKFMQRTLELARDMRPRASWGYYIFPFCFNSASNQSADCPPEVKNDNDQLGWLFESSNALFPSIYMGSTNAEYHYDFVYHRLLETQRLANKVDPQMLADKQTCGRPSRPDVLPYVWYRYGDIETYLSVDDLLISLGTPRVMGLRGAVLWGSTGDVNNRERCLSLQAYLEDTLGPTVRYIRDATIAQLQLRIQGNDAAGDSDSTIHERSVTNSGVVTDPKVGHVTEEKSSGTREIVITNNVLLLWCVICYYMMT